MRRQFNAPNARTHLLDKWRTEQVQRAVGCIVVAGGEISGVRLAELLSMSPRGLPGLLDRVGFIRLERRGPGRGEAWYCIDVRALPKPEATTPALARA